VKKKEKPRGREKEVKGKKLIKNDIYATPTALVPYVQNLKAIEALIKEIKDTYPPYKPKTSEHVYKYTEEHGIVYLAEMVIWYIENPNTLYLKEFNLIKPYTNITVWSATEYFQKYDSCAALLNYAKELQEARLINKALKNEVNGAIVKFILVNKHKWSDKTEQNVNIQSNEIKFDFGTDADRTNNI
jgi:hypothetical protein